MGLTTSRSYPLREVILHKFCVFSNHYLTQGTCRITPVSNLCGTYVKQLRNESIKNVQEKNRKSGLSYGKGNKAWNLKRTASHRGKCTINIPIYEWIPENISDAKKVLVGYPLNQPHTISCLNPMEVEPPDVTNYIMDFTTPLVRHICWFNSLGELYSQNLIPTL